MTSIQPDDRVHAMWAGKVVKGTVIGIDADTFTLLLKNGVSLKVNKREIIRVIIQVKPTIHLKVSTKPFDPRDGGNGKLNDLITFDPKAEQ